MILFGLKKMYRTYVSFLKRFPRTPISLVFYRIEILVLKEKNAYAMICSFNVKMTQRVF